MPRSPANVTTSSVLEGWSINAYLGVVASHVVAGTGIFSDFAAGFSDFFGGRSGTYQNQLSSLYQEAITTLHQKAERLGGNWIVGLAVDIDEISGKGMQMFMVTAMGTAVKATRSTAEARSGRLGVAGTSPDELAAAVRSRQLERAIAAGDLDLDDSTWAFIIEQRVLGASGAVLRRVGTLLYPGPAWQTASAGSQAEWDRAQTFFRRLPAEQASLALYEALSRDEGEAKAATKLIRDLSLMDLRRTADLLQTGTPMARRLSVRALAADQPVYTVEDLAWFSEVIHLLPGAFPTSPQIVHAKGLLGGKKERWICSFCNNDGNALDNLRCIQCRRDVQGFYETDLTPAAAAALLNEKREALAAVLASEGSPQSASAE